MIIDEWDMPIWEVPETQKEYLELSCKENSRELSRFVEKIFCTNRRFCDKVYKIIDILKEILEYK